MPFRETVGHAAVPGGFAQPTGGSRRLIAHSASLRLISATHCFLSSYHSGALPG
ncbi:MAG: hypothetical protein [Olavius algarvensis Gamma 1 endosymbiont]|nr:MAG: hypothetical protein [Olavius algarvensis Gamma 1 endosymbiont]